MAQDEQVPLYPEGGSLAEDLQRLAANRASTTQNYGSIPPPAATPVAVNSGDPDTDELIQRMLREDAEEAAAAATPIAVSTQNHTHSTADNAGVPGSPSSISVSSIRIRTEEEPPAADDGSNIIEAYFEAIKNNNSELISALIDGDFVKVDTRSKDGDTPLVAAVRSNHVRVVQQLVDYGADVNELSVTNDAPAWYNRRYDRTDKYDDIVRTPLMVAAENGHLPLVKLLMEVFHARDDIVPPDGMTALRLAASKGHREVVDYLPSRRIGGLQRWKYKNRKAIRRSKKIVYDLYRFGRIIVFEIPKFFVWSLPKHIIVLPIKRSCVYLWKHKKDIADGIKKMFVETGRGLVRFSKAVAAGTVKGIKGFPGATVRAVKATGRGIVIAAKGTWKFITIDFPKGVVSFSKWLANFTKRAAVWTKNSIIKFISLIKRFIVWFAKEIWKTLTVRLPKALKAIAHYMVTAASYCGGKTLEFFSRVASALHTLVTKVVNWVSGITWKDVWNGFMDVVKFIFVEIPMMLFNGVVHTGKLIKKVMEALFGFVGTIFYYLGVGILLLVTYVPKKIFQLIMELFGAIGRGLHEIAVWVNPKTI